MKHGFVLRSLASILVLALFITSRSVWAGGIGLVSGKIDTAKTPQVSPQSLRHVSPAGRALVIIQFDGPIRSDDLDAIRKSGGEPVSYVPENAYLVNMPVASLTAMRGASRAAWIGELQAGQKIHPRVQKSAAPDLRVTILSLDGAVAADLRAKGYKVDSSRKSALGWQDTRATIPASALDATASFWNVFHIEPQPQYQLFGEREAQTAAGAYPPGGTAPTGPGYVAWLGANGLSGGSGLIVQVTDDGLDQGIATNLPGTAHPDLLGRIAGIFNPTTDPLGNSQGGHGMINAGIIMGNATVGTLGVGGFKLGQGVAPQAQVYATKIFRNSGPFDIGSLTFTDLMKNAQDAGAYFSNNSWGEPLFGDYTADSAEFDLLTRDSDPTEAGNQPRVYFFAAGNIGIYGPGTIGSPASAKNVIAVGASENSDADGIDGCFVTDLEADSHRDMAYFSSRGPVADGRIGICVFAPGTHVQGQASTDPGYAGTTVCDAYWPVGQTDYARSSGTSHSTPVVTGAGMIVYEFFSTQLSGLGHTATPSPALIKAVLANTATDMAGGDDGFGFTLGPIPNTDQGWGSVNLKTLASMKNSLYSSDQEQVFTGSGQNWQKVISVVDPGKPLKITLVWSDAPGNPAVTPNLVNDLDLTMTAGATTYRGNVFSGGASVTGGTADRLNNIESIYIASPAGPYTLSVDAFNIAGDGVPNSGGALDQDFAVFVWNGSNQSPAGIIDIDKSFVNCGDLARVLVSDSDLQGTGTLTVAVSSTTGDSEQLVLAETSPGTGVLLNTITTATGAPAPDGVLQVADGGTVTATYNDADDGSGFPAVATDNAAVDCTAPIISNVGFINIGLDTFTVTFDTNEPCTGLAFSDLACGGSAFSTVTSLGTSHAASFNGLEECTLYHVRLRATDRAGNMVNDDNGGVCYPVRTQIATDTFVDNFEGTIPGWTSTGLWHKISPASNYPNAQSPIHSWWYGSEASGNYNIGANSGSLTSPLITLNSDHQLTFQTWEETDEFLDSRQVIVDDGVTQTVIYNGGDNTLGWKAIGPLDLSAFTGQSVRLIFDFNTFDDFTNTFRGWYVDDVRVYTGTDCLSTLGAVDIEEAGYSCGETLNLVVRDLNALAGPLSVTVTTGNGDSEPVLVSDPDGDKFYNGSIIIGGSAETVAPADGRVQGLDFSTITATYNDADDGGGSPAVDTDTAQLDCRPPVISGVNFTEITDEGFTVRFTTNEAATGAGIAGTVCGAADGSANGPLTNTHALVFTGLQSCTNYRVSLSATDTDGNTGTNNNGGACFLVKTRMLLASLDDDFEPSALAGWTHSAAVGADNWAVRSDPAAHSTVNVYSYETTSGGMTDARLVTPAFTGGGVLTFWHSYNLEFSFDGGVLELSTNGGSSWFDAAPYIVEGGYNGSISDCCGNALQNRSAWTGSQPVMTRVRVNLATLPGSLKARFRFATDAFAISDRWLIDDVKASQIIVCPVNDAGNWELYE